MALLQLYYASLRLCCECYGCVTAVLQLRYGCVAAVFQLYCVAVLRLCYGCVTDVLRFCHGCVKAVLQVRYGLFAGP